MAQPAVEVNALMADRGAHALGRQESAARGPAPQRDLIADAAIDAADIDHALIHADTQIAGFRPGTGHQHRRIRARQPLTLPRFDKAQDDRMGDAQWTHDDRPADVLIFEGWCVGAVPQDAPDLMLPANALERDHDADGRWRAYVNDQLAGGYQTLFGALDTLILLAAPGFEIVHRWRTQQEDDLAARQPAGSALMDTAQISRFIQHYERLTRHILAEMPTRADLTIFLDEDRRVTGSARRPKGTT